MEAQIPPRPLSPLEGLPAELIQAIFLHCLEFSLPRATLRLSRILSDPIIYTWLIRLACSSTNPSARRNFFSPDYLPPPLDPFALPAADRSALQSSIYASRWFTLPLLRQCQRQHIAHGVRRVLADLDMSAGDRAKLLTLDSSSEYETAYAQRNCERRWKGDLVFEARLAPEAGGRPRRLALWLDQGAFHVRHPNALLTSRRDIFRLPAFSGASGAAESPGRVPDHLLRAPWTGEKLELLRLLAAEAYIDEDNEHVRSATVLRDVMRARDFGTFLALMDHVQVMTRESGFYGSWPVLAGHFKLALRDAQGKDDPFVRYLVEKRWDDVPGSQLQLKSDLLAMKVGGDS
jgi:hypothetical protein